MPTKSFRDFIKESLESVHAPLMMDDLLVRKHILKKLYAYGAFQHGHLLGERLWRGVPSHYRGLAKTALKELVREGLVLAHPTAHGVAYQLNILYLGRIEKEIF